MEDKTMGISRAPKLEWNLNTLLQLVSLATLLATGIYVWANTTRDVEELQRWRMGHEQYHKERLAEVKSVEGRTEERFRSIESEVRKIDNLTYRIAAAEQTTATTSAAIKDLQSLVSAQSGDIKVIREILQRLEAGQRRSPP
ncbi:hypothetical protein [Shinella sumterensis]|uniref:Uncharacterized protein n=1 Tax=Shinella sumterensis TaxID=1967501 RepID=A0AA50CMK3_9HYPH|nr:hypothetical protein [Shinella sumterensis]WLR98737.1 hypothetical protein Q9313_06865 [Shinella sumterensis]